MARIIHSINATLSGTCFHEDVIADEEHHRYATELARSADVLLLGRHTYDLFAAFWPSAAHRRDLPDFVVALAHVLAETPKVVVTSRELSMAWRNATRIDASAAGSMRAALHGLSGEVVLFGSPGLAASLAAEGLLDEVRILLQPLFSTSGPKLPAHWRERSMRNVSATRFASGAVFMRFAPGA